MIYCVLTQSELAHAHLPFSNVFHTQNRCSQVVGGATGEDVVEFLDWEIRNTWRTLGGEGKEEEWGKEEKEWGGGDLVEGGEGDGK